MRTRSAAGRTTSISPSASPYPVGEARTVGVGLCPGDDDIPEPYFYVTPHPRPAPGRGPVELPAGRWNERFWFGAVLRGSDAAGGSARHGRWIPRRGGRGMSRNGHHARPFIGPGHCDRSAWSAKLAVLAAAAIDHAWDLPRVEAGLALHACRHAGQRLPTCQRDFLAALHAERGPFARGQARTRREHAVGDGVLDLNPTRPPHGPDRSPSTPPSRTSRAIR